MTPVKTQVYYINRLLGNFTNLLISSKVFWNSAIRSICFSAVRIFNWYGSRLLVATQSLFGKFISLNKKVFSNRFLCRLQNIQRRNQMIQTSLKKKHYLYHIIKGHDRLLQRVPGNFGCTWISDFEILFLISASMLYKIHKTNT